MLSLASNISSIQAVEAKYSASFDGTDDFIDTGQTFQDVFRNSFTFSFWVKPNDGQPASLECFFGSNDNNEDQIQAQVDTNGDIRFIFESNNQSASFRTDPQPFSDGAASSWTHILISVTKNSSANTSVVLYVNGSSVTISSGTLTDTNHGAFTTTRNLFIGAKNNQGSVNSPFDGGIDEFAIFNTALNSDNATAIYNGGSPLNLTFDQGNYNNSSALQVYYKMGDGFFDDKSNGIVHDQDNPGFGNNLVVNGDFSISNTYETTDSPWERSPGSGTTTVIDNGVATFTNVGSTYGKLTQAVTYTSGSTYKLTAIVNGTAGKLMRFRDDVGGNGGLSAFAERSVTMTGGPQNVVKYFVANSNSDELAIERETSSGSYTFTVDNVSLQKLNGKPGITSGGTIFSSDTPTP
tara:strand:- start:5522 stop:6745 length:1224 start_codon:yes stop_codon:yes gene_type:complete